MRKGFHPLLEKTKTKGADRTDCKCNFCIHQQCIPETRWEPAEYYCDADSVNFGTDDGCWLFEDAEDAADAAADRTYEAWRERQLEMRQDK